MTGSEHIIADGEFLQTLIPQKKPFILVDTLTDYTENSLVSHFTIPADHVLVTNNRFSEAGLIENMAQTIALHTGYKYYLNKQPSPTGYIGALKKVEVFQLPMVLQKLVTTALILHDIMGVTLVEAKVECDGIILASGEIKTALAQR